MHYKWLESFNLTQIDTKTLVIGLTFILSLLQVQEMKRMLSVKSFSIKVEEIVKNQQMRNLRLMNIRRSK